MVIYTKLQVLVISLFSFVSASHLFLLVFIFFLVYT